MPVLDTSFLIALEDRDPNAIKLLRSLASRPLLVPPVVQVEFLDGHNHAKAALSRLQEMFTLLHTDSAWVAATATWRTSLRGSGIRVRSADFWIASFAKHHDTPVVTQNARDFEALGIEVLGW